MNISRFAIYRWLFLFGAAMFVVGVALNLIVGIDQRVEWSVWRSSGFRGAEHRRGVAYWDFSGTAMILTGSGLVICLLAFLWALMERWRKSD